VSYNPRRQGYLWRISLKRVSCNFLSAMAIINAAFELGRIAGRHPEQEHRADRRPQKGGSIVTHDDALFLTFLGWAVGWALFAVPAWFAAKAKGAQNTAAVLGLVFGPVGVLAALGLDQRLTCPICTGRLDSGPFPREKTFCQHCRQAICLDEEGAPYRPGEVAPAVLAAAKKKAVDAASAAAGLKARHGR
jgi:hypothetical protein